MTDMDVMLDKEELVRRIARRGNFNLSDTRIFLDSFIWVIEDCLKAGIGIKVRGLGSLFISNLPARKGSKIVSDGKELPPAKRVIFRLAGNLRDLVK